MGPVLIGVIVAVAASALFVAGTMVLRDLVGGKTQAESRLDKIASGNWGSPQSDHASISVWKEDRGAGWQEYFAWLPRPATIDRLAIQADVRLDAAGFVAISLGLALVGVLVGYFVAGSIAWCPIMGGVLAFLPLIWLLRRRKKRMFKITQQLPNALDLISRALRAGHSLNAAISVVGDELDAPIATEFARVYEEQNLGVSMEDALEALTERVPNMDIRFFVTAVLVQRETGGDLAEILDNLAKVIRDRFTVWGQVQALTAEGRLSGVILMALPLLIFFAVYQINRPYLELLFIEPMGRKMLAIAIGLQILGAAVIKKIVNIKV